MAQDWEGEGMAQGWEGWEALGKGAQGLVDWGRGGVAGGREGGVHEVPNGAHLHVCLHVCMSGCGEGLS